MAGLPLTGVFCERGGEFFGVNNLGFCMHQQIKEHESTANAKLQYIFTKVLQNLG